MKSDRIFLLIIFLASFVSAQNVLVRFYPNNEPYAGLTNYPAVKQSVAFSTNSPGWSTNMVEADFYALVASLTPAFNTGSSNAAYLAQAKFDADFADFLSKMDKIETWIDRTSGTNSLNNAQRDNAINDICQTFKKLRRALVNLYKPE